MAAVSENLDLANTAAATAARLRLVQLDMADEAQASREDYLASEVRQAMEPIPQHRRLEFLDMLAQRFPIIANEPAPVPVPVELGPQELLEQLATKGKELPLARREAMLKQLHQVWGIEFVTPAKMQVPPAAAVPPVVTRPAPPPAAPASRGGGIPSAAMEDLARRVGLPSETVFDATLVAQLAGLLVADFAVPLQPLVWKVYRSIQTTDAHERALHQSVQSYLLGRNPQFPGELLQLRQVIAAMVNSIPHLSRELFSQHLECLLPPEIEEAVKAEGGFALFGSDNRYWAKYRQLSSKLQPSSIDDAVRKVLHELISSAMQATASKANGSAK